MGVRASVRGHANLWGVFWNQALGAESCAERRYLVCQALAVSEVLHNQWNPTQRVAFPGTLAQIR